MAEMGVALAQTTSVRRMPWLRSTTSPTDLSSIGLKKLGQPVPELNLASELNSRVPQQTQRYVPSL